MVFGGRLKQEIDKIVIIYSNRLKLVYFDDW